MYRATTVKEQLQEEILQLDFLKVAGVVWHFHVYITSLMVVRGKLGVSDNEMTWR